MGLQDTLRAINWNESGVYHQCIEPLITKSDRKTPIRQVCYAVRRDLFLILGANSLSKEFHNFNEMIQNPLVVKFIGDRDRKLIRNIQELCYPTLQGAKLWAYQQKIKQRRTHSKTIMEQSFAEIPLFKPAVQEIMEKLAYLLRSKNTRNLSSQSNVAYS